jgi:ubiquilin
MPVAFVTIKLPDGGLVHLDVELRTRVEEFRTILAPKCGVKKHRQRLVFAGRLLQDGRTLEAYGIERNSTVHLLYSSGAEADGQGGLDISQMPEQLAALQRHVLANPDILQQMLESPAMQGLLNDHDFLRSLLQMDPRLKKVFEGSQELRDMLSDSEFMKNASDALRNPVHVRDVLRSTDRSMAVLEELGGGTFDVLRQMCEDITKPMEDPAFKKSQALAESAQKKKAADSGPKEDGEEGDGQAVEEVDTGPQLPGWAGTFDTNSMASMMQDGNMQHLLAQMVQAMPGPTARVHPDDPFIDASFLGQMFAAQTVNSMSKLQDCIEKLSMAPDAEEKKAAAAKVAAAGKKGKKGAVGEGEDVTAQATHAQDSPAVLSGLHPSSPACDFATSFKLFLEAEAASPEVRYKGQLQAMEKMGFTDKDACIQALHAAEGNMSKAVDSLMIKS